MTTEDFIKKAIAKYGERFSYEKTVYGKNNNEKVCIICKKHGEFWQTPHSFLAGHSCQECAKEKVKADHTFTTEDFVKKAKEIHGDEFDYSKTEYENMHTKVCIIHPEFGEFWQTPMSHLKGSGRPSWKRINIWDTKRKKKTTEQFINEARAIHGNKYDYSKVNYINPKEKVCIICPKHGEFWQIPYNHLMGKGCKKCATEITVNKNIKTAKKKFIELVKKKYNNIYDYCKVEYVDSKTNICVVCPEHGDYWITPSEHINGKICPQCQTNIKNEKKEEKGQKLFNKFLLKARCKHGWKYDYSKAHQKNSEGKICIICHEKDENGKEHGEFWQTPHNHMMGKGCPKCGIRKRVEKNKSNTDDFIKKAKQIWGNQYDYSKVKYTTAKEKVCIICPIHGEFWQTPDGHLTGSGCYDCSKDGFAKETMLKMHLKNEFHDEEIICQCHLKWLGKQSFDFYFPKYKLAIEYQGVQHFRIVEYFGGEKGFIATQKRDLKKLKLANDNGVKILYFTYVKEDIKNVTYNVIYKENELFNKIKEYIKCKNL